MRRVAKLSPFVVALTVSLLAAAAGAADLPAATRDALSTSKYVYIASSRKDGKLSKPAEIWFMYRDGAVYVASPPTTWRVRRLKAGRTQARIAVGKADGPSFTATGAIVNEPAAQAALLETYAKKYPDGWAQFEEKFRNGFKDGSRVLIKYTPSGT